MRRDSSSISVLDFWLSALAWVYRDAKSRTSDSVSQYVSVLLVLIFNLPGLGKFFVVSALQRDYTVVMGMVIVYAALILALNLVADLLYAALDPRVRLS